MIEIRIIFSLVVRSYTQRQAQSNSTYIKKPWNQKAAEAYDVWDHLVKSKMKHIPIICSIKKSFNFSDRSVNKEMTITFFLSSWLLILRQEQSNIHNKWKKTLTTKIMTSGMWCLWLQAKREGNTKKRSILCISKIGIVHVSWQQRQENENHKEPLNQVNN